MECEDGLDMSCKLSLWLILVFLSSTSDAADVENWLNISILYTS